MTRAGGSAEMLPRARSFRLLAACLFAITVVPGCASAPPTLPSRTPDTIVLLPDASGKTGAIVVSGGGKDLVLSETRQAVVVGENSAPGAPFIMQDNEVASIAGAALNALPPPPKQFILHFEHGTATLTGPSRGLMLQVVRTIKAMAPVDISVVGHTDTVGDRQYNYKLSRKRAQTVADLLVAAGVEESILEITSHGKDNPLIPTGDQVSEPRNRRVEVTIR
ncbi:MAG: OmpA family protein [Thermodesulfobacteriota bacterium]